MSICDLICHSRLPPLERSSESIPIIQQLEHTTVENISQHSYIENNDNSNMTVLEQPQKTFDIVSEAANTLIIEQNTVNKLEINIDKVITAEENNVFCGDNKPKPNIMEEGSKKNIPIDDKVNMQKVKPL